MQGSNLWEILLIGVGLGMLHALDSDHLLTLANFTPNRTSISNSLNFCSRWAMGHGVAILIVGVAVVVFQQAIPFRLASMAERVVGLVLVLLGLGTLLRSARAFTAARGFLPRDEGGANFSSLLNRGSGSPWHQHRVVGIGFLHGISGSAALLALLPMTQLATALQAMAYLLCFSLGVLFAMLVFGGVLGGLFQRLGQRYLRALSVLRLIIAVPAIIIGALMVVNQS
ncbi:MAG: sulfite exporter TauE/SafE family protein [Gammaproteobacteria bacterium]|nr:sulfite exporter TauE/SafE family protein [Gammaproteobacteria bacterium]